MENLPTSIKSLNFINKRTKDFVQKLNIKDTHSLQLSLKYPDNASCFNQNFGNIDKEQLKKVAMQVQFLGYDKDYCMIFAIYGPKIDRNNKDLLIFTLLRIIEQSFYLQKKFKGQAKGFKKYCTQGITLIFFNNCSFKKRNKFPFSSQELFEPIKFDDFKHEVIKELKIKHLVRINEIFLVYPSLLTKSWNYLTSFGLDNGFFDTFFKYSESIYDLVISLGPLFECDRIVSSVVGYDSSVKNKNWRIVFSESQRAHSLIEFASYQKMCELSSADNLENTVQYEYKRSLKDYKLDQANGIPLILSVLMENIVENHIRFEGIFRKVAEEKELIRFENFLFQIEQKYTLSQITIDQFKNEFNQNVIYFEVETITSFFKKVFIQLQTPIFPQEVYSKILSLTIAQIQSQQFNFNSKTKNSSLTFQTIKNQKYQESTEASKNKVTYDVSENMVISVQADKYLFQSKVRQRIAYFEHLCLQPSRKEENISKNIIPHQKPRKQSKIKFKQVPNVKKQKFIAQPKQEHIDILNFQSMGRQYSLSYQVLNQTLKFLRQIKKQQKHNLMSTSNIAICFNPCLFRKPERFRKEKYISIEEEWHQNIKLIKVLQKLISSEDIVYE